MRQFATVAAIALMSCGFAAASPPAPRSADDDEAPPPPVKAGIDVADHIPDRVSLETDSPFYFGAWRRLGVRINGGESVSVVEFCASEGWARCQIFHGGRPKQERGRFVTVTRRGTIEPYWRAPQ